MPERTLPLVPHNGTTLLHTVASAVLDLSEVPNPGTFSLPYPAEAQRALDRTVLACLLRGAEPPRSIPDLLVWCQEIPVVDWPLDLPEDLAAPDEYLIDPHALEPTQLCYEWAIGHPDSAADQIDRDLVFAAIEQCRAASSPSAYVAFRRLLIEHPVLTRETAAATALEPVFLPVATLLPQIYLPAPVAWARDGVFYSCGRCKTLLIPTRDNGWWCENDRCRRTGPAPVGAAYREDTGGGLLALTRPLRLFVTTPGRAELRLEKKLRGLGVQAQMWPEYDVYDLLVPMPDGQVWAVDVKDWANPALLGSHIRPLPAAPRYDRAFVVVPDHRLRRRANYLDVVIKNARRAAVSALTLMSERQFTAAVRDALAGHHAGQAADTENTEDANA
jgi:hypothetical protein